jgi:hypothetical protein
MTEPGLSDADLQDERGEALPSREVMTLITPSAGASVLPGLTGDSSTSPGAGAGGGAPTADTATTAAGSTSSDAAHFTPPPSEGAYDPAATSTSET